MWHSFNWWIFIINMILDCFIIFHNLNFDKLFDGLIMSAQDQLLKPQPEIFEYAIKKYNDLCEVSLN
jgi:FMN phosphatase YigB (HAD superfamily)